jgi:hypothetical protein
MPASLDSQVERPSLLGHASVQPGKARQSLSSIGIHHARVFCSMLINGRKHIVCAAMSQLDNSTFPQMVLYAMQAGAAVSVPADSGE